MGSDNLIAFYFLGLGLNLAWKIAKFLYRYPKTDDYSTRAALCEYFFSDKVAGQTTVITFAVVWVLGAVYVGQVSGLLTEVAGLPQHQSVAFLLGTLAEMLAPKVTARIVRRLNLNG